MTEMETPKIQKKPVSWMACTFIMANIGLILLTAWALYSFGSIRAALAYLKGDRLIVRASSMSFGDVRRGERPVITFDIMNTSDRNITILGARTTCTCVFTDDLPLTVLPGERRSISVGVKTGSREGSIQERVYLYTSFPGQPEVEVRIIGRVLRSGIRSSKLGVR